MATFDMHNAVAIEGTIGETEINLLREAKSFLESYLKWWQEKFNDATDELEKANYSIPLLNKKLDAINSRLNELELEEYK